MVSRDQISFRGFAIFAEPIAVRNRVSELITSDYQPPGATNRSRAPTGFCYSPSTKPPTDNARLTHPKFPPTSPILPKGPKTAYWHCLDLRNVGDPLWKGPALTRPVTEDGQSHSARQKRLFVVDGLIQSAHESVDGNDAQCQPAASVAPKTSRLTPR